MECTFGVINSTEYMRVRNSNRDFTIGRMNTVVITHSDSIVMHNFKITRLLKKTEKYVWYIIEDHTMNIDNTPKLEAENKKLRAMIDYLSMMTDVELEVETNEQRIGEV